MGSENSIAMSQFDFTTGETPPTKARRRILIIVGTRPEAIKLLPLIRALTDNELMEPHVIATGQHPGIVESILALDNLKPSVNLGVGRPGITLNELFASVVTGVQAYCDSTFGPADRPTPERDYDHYPTSCVVHGDTTSAIAGGLAAFHLQIPVVHVEAGLRTSDTRSPFPEELNRQVIGRLSSFHLAPTHLNQQNLVREGIDSGRIFICGNTAIDALQWAAGLHEPYGDPALKDLEDDETSRVVVVTAHRRENWGEGLQRIGTAVAMLAREYPDVRFVVPLHPNPRVGDTLRPLLGGLSNVSLVAPMNYVAFARLLGRAYFAISDSGGVQEEAPALGTPVLVVRDTTERQEGVDAGTLQLVGTSVARITAAARTLLDDPEAHRRMAGRENPYGDGHAAQRIVAAFEHVAFATPAPAQYTSGFNRLEVLRAGGFDEDPREVTQPAPARGQARAEEGAVLDDVALA